MSALCDELFDAILMARQRVYAVADATPLEEVPANLPFRLFVKREDLGPIKAYKWRGAYNPRPRSGTAAGRNYPTSEVNGSSREELPHVRGQGRRQRGATPRPRSGGFAGTGGPRGPIPR